LFGGKIIQAKIVVPSKKGCQGPRNRAVVAKVGVLVARKSTAVK